MAISWRVALALGVTLPVLFCLYVGTASCHNAEHLMGMITAIAAELRGVDVHWTFEGGSLLGAVREGQMLEHEFDNDITILKKDLNKLLSLRGVFHEKYGYHLYSADDYIFRKGLLDLYFLRWTPYLLIVCARIYDPKHWLYTDVYCDHEVKLDDIDDEIHRLGVVMPLSKDTVYYCNNGEDRCACRAASDMYPLSPVTLFHNVEVRLPAKPERILEQCYGSNWRTTVVYKGVKKLFCRPLLLPLVLLCLVAIKFVRCPPYRRMPGIPQRD